MRFAQLTLNVFVRDRKTRKCAFSAIIRKSGDRLHSHAQSQRLFPDFLFSRFSAFSFLSVAFHLRKFSFSKICFQGIPPFFLGRRIQKFFDKNSVIRLKIFQNFRLNWALKIRGILGMMQETFFVKKGCFLGALRNCLYCNNLYNQSILLSAKVAI